MKQKQVHSNLPEETDQGTEKCSLLRHVNYSEKYAFGGRKGRPFNAGGL